MCSSFGGFKAFFEKSDDNLDMLSLTDLEFGLTPKDHDKDVYAGSWFSLPGGKTIAGLSGFTVKMNGDTVTLTPVDYGNKVLQKTSSGYAKDPTKMPKTPITMSKAQYVNLIKRGLDQGAGGMSPMGMPGGLG